MSGIQKRVPQIGALFLSLLLSYHSSAEECSATQIDRYAQVKHIHDGDTLRFKDGTKVRLVGINTPELARNRSPAEPFALAARDGLRELLSSSARIGVQYGREGKDRHGRTLAHLYLDDGRSVQQWLLERGYAVAIAHPPNLHRTGCYVSAEQIARKKNRGVWGESDFLTRDAANLRRGDQGFRLVSGEVTAVKQTRKWVWVTVDKRLGLRIARADERYFDALPLASLVGKEVVARGWLTSRKGRWSIRIRHPSSLEIVKN